MTINSSFCVLFLWNPPICFAVPMINRRTLAPTNLLCSAWQDWPSAPPQDCHSFWLHGNQLQQSRKNSMTRCNIFVLSSGWPFPFYPDIISKPFFLVRINTGQRICCCYIASIRAIVCIGINNPVLTPRQSLGRTIQKRFWLGIGFVHFRGTHDCT